MLGEAAAEVSWRYAAFELDPNVPPEGVDAREYMAGRYAPAMIEKMNERLASIAREEGLPFSDSGARVVRPNTFNAHRLLAAALLDGAARQRAVGAELFAAFWGRGENVGLPDVLASVAAKAGVPAARAEAALIDEGYAQAVRDEEHRASALGIRAVPTFIFADRLMVSGAQTPAVLAEAVREAARTS